MPKKLGTCQQALDARERRALQKKTAREEQEKKLEDEFWKDDDKILNRKQQRKEEKDLKKEEQTIKKKEKEKLFEQEQLGAKSFKQSSNAAPSKLTQNQIEIARQNLVSQLALLQKNTTQTNNDVMLENPNRVNSDTVDAHTVEEAISVLKMDDNDIVGDKHPERRFKSAWNAFEQRMLPQLKEENPSLKLSQLKQMAFKLFQTSPENPKNRPHVEYNSK